MEGNKIRRGRLLRPRYAHSRSKLVEQCRDRVLLEACQEVNLWLVQHEAYYSHQR